eukprot:m.35410 g.35410  ORF g.35410 m.35410 type:complete len:256 (-) comp9595_c0_seq1:44-811(-)
MTEGKRLSYEEAAKLIDPKKGLIMQVWKLGEHYEQWVSKYSLEKSYRLFDSDFLEPFSKTPWYLIPIVWLPIIAILSLMSLRCGANGEDDMFVCRVVEQSPNVVNTKQLPIVLAFGGLLWTGIEYFLHRFVFHISATTPASITFHFIMHGQHHKYPNDPNRLVFPPVAAAILAQLFYAMFRTIFPLHIARGVMAGCLLGYVCYDLIHYFLHHGAPTSKYFASLKRSHMHHHYKEHSVGYGISSKLWDIVFWTQHH